MSRVETPEVSAFFLLVLLFASGACHDVTRLDEVQKLAYSVKPAVVRISAYATATVRYSARSIRAIELDSAAGEHPLDVRSRPAGDESLPTGAGGSGSGFIIHPDGWILTSGHVVEPTRDRSAMEDELLRNGAISVLLRHFDVESLRQAYHGGDLERWIGMVMTSASLKDVRVFNEVELSNGVKLPFHVQRFSPPLSAGGRDLALLRVAARELPLLRLGDSEATRVGQSVWAVGYPAVASSTDEVIGGWLSRDTDLEATFNPGTITALRRDTANVPLFQSNVAIYRGNSGGPVVAMDGAVIGIATWGHKNAEQIKFLVPVDVARQFLAPEHLTPKDGLFDQSYRTALDAAAEGDWTSARSSLATAERLFPNSPDLIRFHHDIDRALRSTPPWRAHPVVAAIGVILPVALVLMVSVAARNRRRVRRKTTDDMVRSISPSVRGSTDPFPLRGMGAALGRFTILNGSRAGERLGLGGSGIRIGRESSVCEIVLENPKISRLHAEVVSVDGKVLLIDRDSSNGTYVNDQRIQRRYLKDGDIIYFGGRNAVAVAFHA
jgi:S1-C subfamily serine protease